MKTLAITSLILTLASGASYTTWLVNSMSEVSLLVIWGGALLIAARTVRIRPRVETQAQAPRLAASPTSAPPKRYVSNRDSKVFPDFVTWQTEIPSLDDFSRFDAS